LFKFLWLLLVVSCFSINFLSFNEYTIFECPKLFEGGILKDVISFSLSFKDYTLFLQLKDYKKD